LREHPKALTTKSVGKTYWWPKGNDLGYGNNVKDVTMDNPQPSPKLLIKKSMGAVHRLNVGRDNNYL